MKLGRIIIPASCWFIAALIQFLTVLLGAPGALCGAVAVGLLTPVWVKFLQLELRAVWLITLATGASLAGIIPFMVGRPSISLALALSPLLALASAGSVALVVGGKHGRCALCNRRFVTDVRFLCPRCHLEVCDRDCWDFDNVRCRLCQQNRVPILSADTRWWDDRLGPRLAQGRCQLCLASCSECDLRACRQCGRLQCRACWDAANGRCHHCQWLIPDLPPLLQAYLGYSPADRVGAIKKEVKLER